MKLLVVTGDHGAPDADKRGGRYNEEDLTAHRAMVEALSSFGDLDCTFLTDHGALLDLVRTTHFDLVVNFCDTGFKNRITLELNIPAYLELLGIPYTGAPPATMVLCYDKAVVRMLAGSLGIPVPREAFLPAARLPTPPDGPYPGLIKPNRADGSLGITKDAVVGTPAQARAYLEWFQRELPGRDALLQEYLDGSEYGVGLIGNDEYGLQALPPLEVDYSCLPAGLNPILSYESKAIPNSPYWTDIKFRRASLDPDEEMQLFEYAKRLFTRLGLRDYGRFDYRRGGDGEIKLMEVNPNPAWSNDGKLAFMASFAGIEYRQLLRRIVDAAVRRAGLPVRP